MNLNFTLNFNLNNKEIKNLPKKILFSHFYSLDDLHYPARFGFKYKKPSFSFLSKVYYTYSIYTRMSIFLQLLLYLSSATRKTKAQRPDQSKRNDYWNKTLSVSSFQFRDPVFTMNKNTQRIM